MLQFPKNFLWGSSTSGPQSEGRVLEDGKGLNIWDYWYQEQPDKFHNQIGPQEASMFYAHYQEDINLLIETGHNAFRTSIQWSRLFPDGDGPINPKAVEFYRDMFQRIKAAGIYLMINLYHFDMPMALQKRGGWESRETVEAFVRYATTCFELFSPYVDAWVTFNEPIVHVECGYLYQYHYPEVVDAKRAVQVAFHTQLASALAIQAGHRFDSNLKIGIILNLTPAYPRSEHPADIKAARIAELFQIKSFLDPSVQGHYPAELIEILRAHDLLPVVHEGDLSLIDSNRVDFLGVNYYQPLRVCAPRFLPNPEAPFMPHYYFDHYEMPGRKMNPHRGWEIYEQGIYDIAMMIKNEYNNIEWVLTENGMGVEGESTYRENGVIQDTYRIEFMKNHLKMLHQAIEDGAACRGYLVWTFIDCWSWLNAYKNRYGLVEFNVETHERTLKQSGYWFKELSEKNGFEED